MAALLRRSIQVRVLELVTLMRKALPAGDMCAEENIDLCSDKRMQDAQTMSALLLEDCNMWVDSRNLLARQDLMKDQEDFLKPEATLADALLPITQFPKLVMEAFRSEGEGSTPVSMLAAYARLHRSCRLVMDFAKQGAVSWDEPWPA